MQLIICNNGVVLTTQVNVRCGHVPLMIKITG